MKSIVRFFDKLEDKVRGWFSHWPILYGFLGGIGVVLFWRGVWHTADYLSAFVAKTQFGGSSIDLTLTLWWDGPISIVIGATLLLMSGLFVSNFIGNEIIISGLKGEKKIAEKTETEVRTEGRAISDIKEELDEIVSRLDDLEKRK